MKIVSPGSADLEGLAKKAGFILPDRQREIRWRERLEASADSEERPDEKLRVMIERESGIPLLEDEIADFSAGSSIRELLARRLHLFSDIRQPWRNTDIRRAPPKTQRPEPARPASPKSIRVVCYHCNQSVIPKIIRQNSFAGAVNIPVGDRSVIAPFQSTRFHRECPTCGAPFQDDETIRNLNGDMDPETSKAMWTGIWAFAGIAFVVIVLMMLSLPSQ